MEFYDRVSAGGIRRTADGYLVADAKVARTGIQTYLGAEVGRPGMPIVRVFRPEDEVFGRDAMNTYAHRPMTNNHPKEPVTAENWKDFSIGQTGGDVVRDGEFVRVPLVLMDAVAIKDFEDGKRELSMGYEAEIVFQDGEINGEKYDAIQTNLRMNHLALVDRARGGDQLRIGDDNHPSVKEKSTMSDIKTRTIMVDGLSVETTDAGAQAIEKLQKELSDAEKLYIDATDSHKTALADKDKEIAAKDAEIDDLKGKQISDADLDIKVQSRADLVAKAKTLHDADYTGKSDADIKKAVVLAKFGDTSVKDKSQDYIDARFDILVEQGVKDPVRQALTTHTGQVTDADTAYAQYVKDLNTGSYHKKEAH